MIKLRCKNIIFNLKRTVTKKFVQWSKLSRRQKLWYSASLALVLIALVGPIIVFNTLNPFWAKAGWFDDNWQYRQKVPINNSGTTQTDYQVMVTVDTSALVTASKLQANCNDLRLTDQGGKLLKFWIEPTTCNTTTTKIWVKVPTIHVASSGASTDIFLYYGNPGAAAGATTADQVFIRDMTSAAAAWPLNETSGAVATATHPAVSAGRNTMVDGDMEDNDGSPTSAWQVDNVSSALSKQSSSPHGGTQLLRVTRSGANATVGALQAILVVGKSYRVTGYARSDGNTTPVFGTAGGNKWTGTTSTSWQAFDVTFVHDSSTGAYLRAVTTADNQYAEFDDVVVTLLNIPASSSFTGSELLTDGNMEDNDGNPISAWSAGNGATLSKQGDAHGGSYVLRTVRNGTNNPVAGQTILTLGKTYRLIGYARSDGNTSPIIRNNSVSIYTGTNSTSWQSVDYVFVAAATSVYIGSNASVDGQYAEWDDVSVTEVSPMTGSISGATLNSASGDTRFPPAYSFDGSNDNVNIYSSDLNSAFNPDEGTLIAWAKVSGSGVWSDSTKHGIAYLRADGNNLVSLWKDTDNKLYAAYLAGSGNQTVLISTATTDWFQVAVSWSKSNDQVKAYFNGLQTGTTRTGLGTWTGNFSTTLSAIGSLSNAGASPWSGLIADTRLYSRALSAAEIVDLYGSSTSGRQAYYTGNYAGKELIRKNDTGVTVGTLGTEEVTPGPLAYWKFDDGTGQSVQDSSSHRFDGTRGADSGSSTDDPTWLTEDQCISGKCLSFDGGDYLAVADNSQLAPSTITISVWVNPTSLPTSGNIMGVVDKRDDNNSPYNGYVLELWNSSGTQKVLFLSKSAGFQANYTLPTNQWSHIVATQTGTTQTLYINGVAQNNVGGVANAIVNPSSIPLLIGKRQDGKFFTGKIDEVKIYPYARTADQVKNDFNQYATKVASPNEKYLSDGLVGYWKMDEVSGTTVADASGNGNTGTLTNAQETGTSDASGNSTTTLIDSDSASLSATDDAYNGMILNFTSACGSITSGTQRFITDYTGASKTFTVGAALAAAPDNCAYSILHQVGGKYGSGVQFEGTNDYVTIADSTSLTIGTNDVTYAAWVKRPAGISASEFIFDKTNNTYFELFMNSSGSFVSRIDNGQITSASGLADGNWHQIVMVVKRGKTGQAYVDGVASGSQVTLGSVASLNNAVALNIGRRPSGNYLHGSVDELRIYNRAFSPTEVAALYNWAPGPMAHWKFDEGGGTSAYDSSGNNKTGTLNNGATWTEGKFGKAVRLNYDSDQDQTVSYTTFNHNFQFTKEAWIKPTTISGCDSSRCSIISYYFELAATSLQYYDYNLTSQGWHLGGTIKLNTWQHAAVTYDGATLKMYLNGLLVQSVATTEIAPTHTTSGIIGGYDNTLRNFRGDIDDVRIYNYPRTQAQILQDMNAEAMSNLTSDTAGGAPEMIAHYKFDEQQGQTVNNEIKNGSSGTLGTSSSVAADDPTWKTAASGSCKVNGCLSFDGGDNVTAGTTGLSATAGSMSMWFNPSSTAATQYMFSPALKSFVLRLDY